MGIALSQTRAVWRTQLTVIYEEIVSKAMNKIKNLRRRQKVNRDGKGRSVEGKSPSIDPGRTMRSVKTTLHLSLAVVLIGGLFMPRETEAAVLIGYWTFDEGSGQTAADSSGNGNDGTLGSSAGADAGEHAWATVTTRQPPRQERP